MLDTLKLKYFQGKQYIPDIINAPMREQFRGIPIIKTGNIDEAICPTGALKSNPASIDLGKCTLCGACKSEAISFSNNYKLSATQRETLIITENLTPEDYEKMAIKARNEIRKVFSKSLKLRQVSAGGCNGCEMELNACSNCNFDMGRFGIDFVASPRHADGLVITGPITKNMAYALEDCYKSLPEPKIVILAGACAISGGVFQDSTELDRSFLEKYPIDLYIPGCPIHPLTFINGVLSFITKK
ncbi:MAG: NADH:ubiquinone oxidoreductase [Cyanobacteria bacterium SIG28]|nr:NADH:ubiquinone oxidoreductase [Cyanobacteria bacterium SIG28]